NLMLFEVAKWLATMKGTDEDRRRYFELKVHQNNLPYKNLNEFYQAIDNFEHGPEYRHYTFELETDCNPDVQHIYSQNPIEAIKDLIGNLEWKKHMSYAPRMEWVLAADGQKIQVVSKMASVMQLMLDLLVKAGIEGIEVHCADGGVRRGYPVLAKQISDWQEICTGTCSVQTRCPKCMVAYEKRGELRAPAQLCTKLQTLQAILDNINGHAAKAKKLGLRPTWPYWADMPYAHGGELVGLDMLHQIHKGMFKTHLYQWCANMLGDAEIDDRFRGLPRFHGLRHFQDRVSTISQWTGNEAKAMERTFVTITAAPQPVGVGQAIRALMDFMYHAHLLQLDEVDLRQMRVDLETFHSNKEAFWIIGVYISGIGWKGISKLHQLEHFMEQILEFGTTDGYTTETTECLHKYLVKNPYWQISAAGNQTKQMLIQCMLPKRKLWDDDGDFCGGGDHCVVDVKEVEIRPAGKYYRAWPRNEVQLQPKEPVLEDVAHEQEAPGLWAALQDYIDTVEADLTYQLQPMLKIGTWSFFKLAHPPLPFAPL
ncbi:hypothetical protein FRC11_009799, partial [Ceratobasidium sp. 423]